MKCLSCRQDILEVRGTRGLFVTRLTTDGWCPSSTNKHQHVADGATFVPLHTVRARRVRMRRRLSRSRGN